MRTTYGSVLPGMELDGVGGKLIVVEGTDGIGRTTQVALLKPWLEEQGRAVLETGIMRSALAGKGIKRARQGHTLGRITMSLFYATDFANRLEDEIVPALRAGFVVLADRYIYSLMAQSLVRGVDSRWITNVYDFALRPDAVFYLRAGVNDIVPRVVFSRGFDYWECGMDVFPGDDMYDSFRRYQTALLEHFDRLGERYGFTVIDAAADPVTIFDQLRGGVAQVLRDNGRQPVATAPIATRATRSAKLAPMTGRNGDEPR